MGCVRAEYAKDLSDYRDARAAVAELIEAAQRVLDKEWEFGVDQPHCLQLNNAIKRINGAA